jgi:hypothetical protein
MFKISIISLIIANIIPIIGAMMFDWGVFEIMILFWAETAIIIFYFIIRIIFIYKYWSILLVPFFLFHSGAFMFIHLMIINLISVFPQNYIYTGQIIANLKDVFEHWEFVLLPLFISHGISFIFNFLVNKEYLKSDYKTNTNKINTNVYPRILFMQAALIIGFMLSLIIGQTIGFILILFGVKIYFDLLAHKKEHKL